ncbi:MAG TPA: hypothetical protein VFZ66_11125 [Herpetosiphonaceae bacterium]
MDNKDLEIQAKVGAFARKMGRRNFLSRGAAAVAGMIAAAVIGKMEGTETAFADSAPCYPPYGVYCSGCGADSTCPSYYSTCTTSNDVCSDGTRLTSSGQCIYSIGWWYTSSPIGQRHKCRDCIRSGPILCKGGNYCGCRSTLHY